ncbi:MAG TPA: tape measure protein [Luteimonas sp.]
MATSLRELIVSVSADTTKYQREMDRASRMGATYFRSVKEGGATASRSWDMQTAAARSHANALEASTQAIGRYAALAAGAFSVGQLVSMADDWGQISARIRMATGSQEEFALAQSRLLDIANRTYRDYNEAADQFAGTAQSMRELGFAASDTLDAAEALGLALVAGGSNAQRGAAANDAWAKSMVQGRIATDQFQTLLLQTPRVIQALGEGLGKTTAELQQMAKDGQLTAQVVVPAITSQMGKLRDEVESMPTTVQDAGIRFRNELRAWVGGANDTYGATQVLVGGIELVADNLEELIVIGGAAAFGAMAGKMVQIGQAAVTASIGIVQSRLAAVAETVAIRDATAAGLAKAQADVRRAQAAMGSVRGTAASAAATRNYANALLVERQATIAATQAQAAYAQATSSAVMAKRAALGLLGGPAGLAITVGMVAAGWLLFRDNSDQATRALQDMAGPLDEVLAKYKELGSAQQLQAIRDAEEAVTQAAGNMRSAVANLELNIGEGALGELFRQIDTDVQAGALSVEDGSRRMVEALNRYFKARDPGDRMRSYLIDQVARWEQNAQAVDTNRERIEAFNGANRAAEAQANGTAGAINAQAGALDVLGAAADAAGKKIQSALVSLPGQIERIGKSAGQVARLDVRDWFRGQAASGVDFSNQEDPQVQALMQQGVQYIRLMTEQDSKQKALAASTRALAAARKAAAQVSDADEHLIRLNESYADQVLSLERQIALHGEVGRSGAMAYDLVHGSLSSLGGAQKEYLQGLAEWLDWLDDVAALEGVWADTAKEHRKYSEDAKKNLSDMQAFADQAARNMQTALGDNLYDILGGKFDGIAGRFADMLRRMAAELAASQMWQALGSAMAGYSGQGWWGNLIRGAGGAMQGTDGGRAGGGQISPWSAYDITEHGDPEVLRIGGRQVLLTGSKGGMVSPLMQRDGGGGGQPPQLNVTIVKGANEDRVEEPVANKNGGFDLRIFMKSEIQRTFAGGDMDDTLRMMGVPLNRGGR